MNNRFRVFNVTRGYALKHKAALKAIENCACAWVEFGVSVRDLTIAEAIRARNEQAAKCEPLAFAELPGVMYEPTASAVSSSFERMSLVRAANHFVCQ
jgi:hypothetical protein